MEDRFFELSLMKWDQASIFEALQGPGPLLGVLEEPKGKASLGMALWGLAG